MQCLKQIKNGDFILYITFFLRLFFQNATAYKTACVKIKSVYLCSVLRTDFECDRFEYKEAIYFMFANSFYS